MNPGTIYHDVEGEMTPEDVERAKADLLRYAEAQREVERLERLYGTVALDSSGKPVGDVKPVYGPPPEAVAQARRIKARRRRLGQSGFAVGTMAMPGKKASHQTRNSR